MKYLTIAFLFLAFFVKAQTDTSYYEVINGSNFLVESRTSASGLITVTKTPVANIYDRFSIALSEKTQALYDLYRTTKDTDSRVRKLIQENNDVLDATGQNKLDSIKAVVGPTLAGTWNVLDYNRASTITVTYNAENGNLRWGGTGTNIICLSENVIQFRNWLGANLVLFKQGEKWATLNGAVTFSR